MTLTNDRFIGREKELKELKSLFSRPGFDLLLLFGRRRIGKTELLLEFLKRNKCLSTYFMGSKATEEVNVKDLSYSIFKTFGLNKSLPPLTDWNSLFHFLDDQEFKEKYVLILDEFQYLANTNAKDNQVLTSIIQKFADKWSRENKNIFLILSGSSVSYLSNLASYSNPLYGRITKQIELFPLSYFNLNEFFPNYTSEEKIQIYSVFGGIPGYLKYVDDSKSVNENICDLVIDDEGRLHNEVEFLLKDELKNLYVYSSILRAVGNGATKISKISSWTGIEVTSLPVYLNVLENTVHLLRKVNPIGSKKKNGIYEIADPFFNFYFSFCAKHIQEFEIISPKDFVKLYMTKEIFNSYVGLCFEKICKNFLINKPREGNLPFIAKAIGKWWGVNPKRKTATDIDIVIEGLDKVICCECKFTDKPLSKQDVLDLIQDGNICLDKPVFANYFFLKTPPSKEAEELIKADKNNRIILCDDLFQREK